MQAWHISWWLLPLQSAMGKISFGFLCSHAPTTAQRMIGAAEPSCSGIDKAQHIMEALQEHALAWGRQEESAASF